MAGNDDVIDDILDPIEPSAAEWAQWQRWHAECFAAPPDTFASLWQMWREGWISPDELHARLDAIRIRGAFRADGSWLGYDYARQEWVEGR